jgi:hypothetical protein
MASRPRVTDFFLPNLPQLPNRELYFSVPLGAGCTTKRRADTTHRPAFFLLATFIRRVILIADCVRGRDARSRPRPC